VPRLVRKEEELIVPLLLKYRETAKLLNISERHVENLAAQGLLEKVRLGDTAVRITRASALKLAEARTAAE
jgi:excisionase family DNA binding protein